MCVYVYPLNNIATITIVAVSTGPMLAPLERGDCMKSSKTMYEIAKARSKERGPRVLNSYCGYVTTRSELLEIFRTEGFRDETVDRFTKRWLAAGQIFYYLNVIIFEPLPEDFSALDEYAKEAQDKAGYKIIIGTKEVFA